MYSASDTIASSADKLIEFFGSKWDKIVSFIHSDNKDDSTSISTFGFPVKKFKFDIKNVGEYENGRSVFLKDKQPFIKYKRGTFPLVQISENEFIIDGDDMFGKANSRITFNTDKNKLGIDHRVFIREEINHKYFLKVSGK